MTSETELNADLILRYLASLYRASKKCDYVERQSIQSVTGLQPYKIVQAVDILRSASLVKTIQTQDMPFMFHSLILTPKGIDEFEKREFARILKPLEEKSEMSTEPSPIKQKTPISTIELFDKIITHPQIRQVSRVHFENGNYRNAVLDAAIKLEEMIKQKADYPKDNKGREISGVNLMHLVFDSNKPILSWCKNERQIEKDELEGYKLIFAGTVLGIRDTKAHAIFEIEPMRALKLLTLITLLAELVDASKLPEEIKIK